MIDIGQSEQTEGVSIVGETQKSKEYFYDDYSTYSSFHEWDRKRVGSRNFPVFVTSLNFHKKKIYCNLIRCYNS